MPANPFLIQRLQGIQQQLMGGYLGGAAMASSSKGREREKFIDRFLSQVLPPSYRFGTGDVTDEAGNRSGQVDVVVEFPFFPSLPMVGSSPRLYLAEGVAAVIEVKSDLAGQWSEVERTSAALKPLNRMGATMLSIGQAPGPKIPLIAVGYKGWQTQKTLTEKVQSGTVDAALIIESGFFTSSQSYLGATASGPHGLWALISVLYESMARLVSAFRQPIKYLLEQQS